LPLTGDARAARILELIFQPAVKKQIRRAEFIPPERTEVRSTRKSRS